MKYIRGKKTKGYTLSWFRKLEKRVLKESSSREVQDSHKIISSNREAIKIQSQNVSKNRWKWE